MIQTYGKAFIRQGVNRQIAAHKESFDAVVFAIYSDPADNYCMVKIQGSDTQIKAYYPANTQCRPDYIKVGNAVRVVHTGGDSGRIEVAGHGQLLPSPIAGGTAPSSPTAVDAVLSGCQVVPMPVT